MIPVIDLKSSTALNAIEEAYNSVGFAVFTNALEYKEKTDMNCWFDEMKSFFELDLETRRSIHMKEIPILAIV